MGPAELHIRRRYRAGHVGFGFATLKGYTPNKQTLPDGSDRSDKREVMFRNRLRATLARLNPDLSEAALKQAVSVLTASHTAMSVVAANQDV